MNQDPVDVVINVFREAVRMGFPAYAIRLGHNSLLVTTKHGKDVYIISKYLDPFSDGISLALTTGSNVNILEAIIVAESIRGEWIFYPERIPEAVAFRPNLLDRVEAVTWTRRLKALALGSWRQLDLKEPGYSAVNIEGGLEVAIKDVVRNLILAWVNCLTGSTIISLEWQAKMNLLEGEVNEMYNVVEKLLVKVIEKKACETLWFEGKREFKIEG